MAVTTTQQSVVVTTTLGNNSTVSTSVETAPTVELTQSGGNTVITAMQGMTGADGAAGASAYQLAMSQGFVGTLSEYLASLHGADGAGAWGAIDGTLSDQTDLQAALDAKLDTVTSGVLTSTLDALAATASLKGGQLYFNGETARWAVGNPDGSGYQPLAPQSDVDGISSMLGNYATTTDLSTLQAVVDGKQAAGLYLDQINALALSGQAGKVLKVNATEDGLELGAGGGTTTNAVTFNNAGTGAASGTTFDGSVARTISYNTIGAQPAGSYQTADATLTALAALSWTAGTQVPVFTAADTVSFKTVGSATGNLLDKAAGDALYTPVAHATSSITTSGHTMSTATVLGRNTASTGAIEELTLGSSLSMAGGQLKVVGLPNGITFDNTGAGNASGISYTGSTSRTVSYNTIGAAASTHTHAYTDVVSVPTGTVFYRKTAATGAAETQTLATLKTDLGLTGTNSGDQTITLSGAVSGSGTGAITTSLGTGVVGLSNMANVATGTVFYRKTAATGAPEVQTLATLKTDLGLTGTNSGDQTITLTGDVTGSGTGSFATSIGSNKVTRGMLAATAGAALLGATAAGNVSDLSGTQVTALLDTFTSSLKGLVPSSGGGTTNFLRADGTWAAPSVTGGGTTTNAITWNNGGAGDASGTTFNGSVARTISYNTIGAAPLASPTFTGKVTTVASATGGAGLNLPHGTAPTSPANGDVWTTTSGVQARINGGTKTLANINDAQTMSGKITFSGGADFPIGNVNIANAIVTGGYDGSNQAQDGVVRAPDSYGGFPYGDQPGWNLYLKGGRGFGTQTAGSIIFQTATNNAASGVLQSAPTTRATIDQNGLAVTGTLSATGAITGSNLSGTNTGDESSSTILTKLSGASGGGTTNFLRADGTWAAPAGGSSSSGMAWAPVTATGTGASQNITIPESGLSASDILVFVNGVKITPTSDYTVSGTTVTLTTDNSGDYVEILKPAGGSVSGGSSLTSTSSFLTADITLGTSFSDGPSLSLAAGTYLINAQVHFSGTNPNGPFHGNAKIMSGATCVSSGGVFIKPDSSTFHGEATVPLTALVTLTGTTTVKIQVCSDTGSSAYVLATPNYISSGATNTATGIFAVKIA